MGGTHTPDAPWLLLPLAFMPLGNTPEGRQGLGSASQQQNKAKAMDVTSMVVLHKTVTSILLADSVDSLNFWLWQSTLSSVQWEAPVARNQGKPANWVLQARNWGRPARNSDHQLTDHKKLNPVNKHASLEGEPRWRRCPGWHLRDNLESEPKIGAPSQAWNKTKLEDDQFFALSH